MNRSIERLQNAIEFLDMVRNTPAHDRAEGVMRDALNGLEESAREAVKDYLVTDYYTDRARGDHAAKAT